MGMKTGRGAIGILTIAALLTGCGETTVQDIKNWQTAGNTSKLIKATESSYSQDIRFAAIDALGEMHAESAIDTLGALFNDDDLGIVLHSTDALTKMRTPASQKYLLHALKNGSPRVRTMAAASLGECTTPDAVAPLIHALDDEYQAAADAAAVSLGSYDTPEAIGPLSAKIDARSQTMRLACAQALSSIGGDAAAPGLARALDDISEDVRNTAIAGLVAIGKPAAVDPAQTALHSTNPAARESGLIVLKQLNAVPTSGSGFVWYQLGRTKVDRKKVIIDDTVVEQICAQGADAIDALLDAVRHPDPAIRKHAFLALLAIGEPCTAKAVQAANTHADETARRWFEGRSSWAGAPSWRLDLWGAATALNPNFKFNPAKAAELDKMDSESRSVLTSSQFKPSSEFIPLLIKQLAYTDADPKNAHAKVHLSAAKKRLKKFGQEAVYPLMAALGDSDLQTAGIAAQLLTENEVPEARPAIIETFSARLEAGDNLGGTALYEALQKMDDPATEPLLIRVRPNEGRALQVFQQKYPGIRSSVLPSQYVATDDGKPVLFKIGYYPGAHMKEMKMIFRKHPDGEWKPYPALPDELPQ